MAWVLTKGLQNLRNQVNEAFPDRDKDSDGTIGDLAHMGRTSGHNADDTSGSKPEWDGDPDDTAEVRAWDMDVNLNAPPATAQQVVDHIRHLPGVSAVLRYMIYNRRIYKASNGWYPEAYDGPSPHTEHIHFSGAYSQAADNNTSFDYRLEEIPVALTAADKAWIEGRLDQRAKEDLEDISGLLNKLTETISFATGGGQHSPVGDAVLNSSYPAEPDGQRQLVWVNLQRLQSDLTAVLAKLSA
jgi:hypothetical protein